ncbi:DUF4129 domain-containing protein [bacterium]|nr:DUF4129 domain-containing protein [bacterium]
MSLSRARSRKMPTQMLDASFHQRRLLYVFTYLSALVALIILHLALDDLNLTLGLIGALTAGFVYSYYVAPRFRSATTYVVSALAVALSVFYFLQIQSDVTKYGNYLGILLGILTALLAYKAFSPGDHRFIMMVCTIFLLFSSVASYDLKFMLLLPLFLIFAGVALYIANQIEVAVRVAGTTGRSVDLRFSVGISFLLVLVRAIIGLIALSVVAYVFTPHTSEGQRRLILTGAPTVSRPDETPAEDDQISSEIQSPEGNAEIGLGEDFDLTGSGRLSEDARPVLQMKCHRSGYLRARVYDIYTGSGWIQSPWLDPDKPKLDPNETVLFKLTADQSINRMESDAFAVYGVRLFDFPSETSVDRLRRQHGVIIPQRRDDETTRRGKSFNIYSLNDIPDLEYDIVRQEITILEQQPPFYFAMYQPFRLENISRTEHSGPLDEPQVTRASTIQPWPMNLPHPENFTYTVYSMEVRAKPGQLTEVYEKGPPEIVDFYTQLPREPQYDATVHGRLGIQPDEYRPVTRQLLNFAGQFTPPVLPDDPESSSLSVYEKVMSIYNYLLDEENGFTYSREYDELDPEMETCEAFLFGNRTGYCRYFASAMAVMCRINEIPARIVTGYSPTTYSLIDNAYIYKASNAHAWVEIYFDGYGWIMFDPSPVSRSPYTGGQTTQWMGGVIDFLQDLFIIDPAGTQQVILQALAQAWQSAVGNALSLVTLLASVGLLWLALWLAGRYRRSSRYGRLRPENAVVETYAAVADQLERLGIRPGTGQTGSAFLRSAGRQLAPLADGLTRLTPIYQRAAFSPRQPDEPDLIAAAEVLTAVRAYVREELQRRKQRK